MSRASDEVMLGGADARESGLVGDLLVLTKARLSLLVIVTTFVGFCIGSGDVLDWWALVNTCGGTALAAAAAAVLNQWAEVHVDRLMERTKARPLPAGRMRSRSALILGLGLLVAGMSWLWASTNALSALLAGATVFIYILIYTPMKRRTAACTFVGAVSGAIPPVIGWAAASGADPLLAPSAWILFGILFAWQMPHFLAIAWMYRDEYAQAGFVMLKRDDVTGVVTAMTSLLFTVVLSGVCLTAWRLQVSGIGFLVGASVLNACLMVMAVRFLLVRSRSAARLLFFGSIFYLPLVLGLMVFTKK